MNDRTPTRHFYVTLFDRNYYLRGVTMLRSLIRHSSTPPFINVLALDRDTEQWLTDLALPGVCVTPHRDFEVLMGTIALQHTRTWQEYCWTCASLYTLFTAPLANWNITYLDADLYFFSDPQVIHDEIADKSIGIIPHQFAPRDRERFEVNGRYNVSWVSFKGTVGRQCLQDWALQCREWCYYRNEDGKFGDQGYLDTWVFKYPHEVCEIENVGAGTAPWNVDQYRLHLGLGDAVFVDSAYMETPLVFYHFSGFKSLSHLAGPNWTISPITEELIYTPYYEAMTHEHNQHERRYQPQQKFYHVPLAGEI